MIFFYYGVRTRTLGIDAWKHAITAFIPGYVFGMICDLLGYPKLVVGCVVCRVRCAAALQFADQCASSFCKNVYLHANC